LKNIRLFRDASGLRSFPRAIGTSFLLISRALHPDVFKQPGEKLLFQKPAKVNLNKIVIYNAVNIKFGYPLVEIRNPREILHD
jgi:hypothetical protein